MSRTLESAAAQDDVVRVVEFWRPGNLAKFLEEESGEIAKLEDNEVCEKGLFLEKLWSAVEYRIADNFLSHNEEIPPEIQKEFDRFYDTVFHPKVISSTKERIELAEKLRRFGEAQGIEPYFFTPELITQYAEDNEEDAKEKLAVLKTEQPDFWVKRKAGFKKELDPSKIPPFTARSLLEDYRRLAQKHEVPTKKAY